MSEPRGYDPAALEAAARTNYIINGDDPNAPSWESLAPEEALCWIDDTLKVFNSYAAAQLAPSVPAGAEVAAVLAKYWRFSLDRDYVRSADADLAELLDDLVGSQRQAATGERTAGGELTFGEEYWRGHSVGRCEEREHYLSSGNAEQDRADLTELIRNGLLEDDGIGAQYRRTDDGLPADLARWIIDAGWSKPAAPPAPSAHGVAALLAEYRGRLVLQEDEPKYRAVMPCDEIVRLLAPSGADGQEDGRG